MQRIASACLPRSLTCCCQLSAWPAARLPLRPSSCPARGHGHGLGRLLRERRGLPPTARHWETESGCASAAQPSPVHDDRVAGEVADAAQPLEHRPDHALRVTPAKGRYAGEFADRRNAPAAGADPYVAWLRILHEFQVRLPVFEDN